MKNENPLILAVETSGRLGSVAIAQGQELLGEKQFTGPMRHSAEIFPDILGLLEQFNRKPADIEQIFISIGPGSFTGLRIAVTIAKSMSLANQAKIVAVDTLDCIAANVIDFSGRAGFTPPTQTFERLAVILDAKRGQFFIAVYEITNDAIWKKILPDCLMTSEEFLSRFIDKPICGERSRTIALVGEGLVYYKNNFNAPAIKVLDEKFWNPSAANIHKLGWQKTQRGQFSDPISLVPNYIRGPDVKIKQF